MSHQDAIKGHWSLLVDRNIVYRDISENNMIITDPGMTDGYSGMLIDLDLAKEIWQPKRCAESDWKNGVHDNRSDACRRPYIPP